MNTSARILAITALLIAGGLHANERPGVRVSHFEPLEKLRLAEALTLQGEVILRFQALGKSFDLRLIPNDRLLAAIPRSRLPAGLRLYTGKLAGHSDSWARIVIAEGIPSGIVWDGTDMYALEAPGDSAVNSSVPLIYRIADSHIDPGAMTCASGEFAARNAAAAYENLVAELDVFIEEAAGAVKQLNLGLLGDSIFVADMNNSGTDPSAALLARLNIVDGIYSEQLGIQLAVPADALQLFDATSDPFSGTTSAGDLLNELSDYRSGSEVQRAQGLTHLYTGRDLDGSTVGIAFRGGGPSASLCSRAFGAGLSEGNFGAFTDALIAAHEIGHNFGAEHDGEAGSVCESQTGRFIMSPSVSATDEFSPCSITTMQTAIDAATCFVPIPGVDIAITAISPEQSVLLGNSAIVNFSAENVGTDQSVNVVVDLTVPDVAAIESSSTTAGSCSSGAGGLNCQLGNIASGTSVLVSVNVIGSNVGTGSFDADVAAASDDDTSNNQATATLTVDPAVDLAVAVPNAPLVTINQGTVFGIAVSNTAPLEAQNAVLTLTADSGLRVDTASWDLGTCSVTGPQVECRVSNFPGQTEALLEIGVTGVTGGVQSYSVGLSSATEDRNPSNNSAGGSVSVNDPQVQGGSAGAGGGGGTGAPGLLLLFMAAVLRWRRGHNRPCMEDVIGR